MAFAVDSFWTGALSDDFSTAGNWTAGVPMSFADNAIVDGGANLPVVISASIGTMDLGGFQLGTSGVAGGHVVQNGGTLNVSADFKSHVGDQGTLASSWIMNNDAIMLYDEPESAAGSGYGLDGGGEDLEIGAQSGAGGVVGRMEMHDTSVLRIADDLKIGAEDNGNGEFYMDGDSEVTVGSGISVAEGSGSIGKLTVAGNALLISGNSAGAGRSDIGYTNEGYLTMSRGGLGSELPVEVGFRDNARIYVRTMQHRDGLTQMSVEGSAEFHIFDVFRFAAPDLGVASIAGSVLASDFTSHMAQNVDSEMYVTLKDNAVMTVDSAPTDGFWQGLALSGGNNRGDPPAGGGKSTIDVSGSATFIVQQDLHMTFGFDTTAESTLKVTGANATIAVNGDLRMSIDDLGTINPGTSTLYSVITSANHSTIDVGGTAFIREGNLLVELDGYVPTGGESYTILAANAVTGTSFRDVDFSLAGLVDGLTWDLNIGASSVVLNVLGSVLLCDFDGDTDCDIDDVDMLITEIAAGTNGASFDLTGDGLVNLADRDAWLSQAGAENLPSGNPYLVGDANLDGSVDVPDFNIWNSAKFTTTGKWSMADFNADGSTDVPDFNAWNSNKFQSANTAAVPEPSTWVLTLLITLGTLCWYRRK